MLNGLEICVRLQFITKKNGINFMLSLINGCDLIVLTHPISLNFFWFVVWLAFPRQLIHNFHKFFISFACAVVAIYLSLVRNVNKKQQPQ